jgi:hypothetical protein
MTLIFWADDILPRLATNRQGDTSFRIHEPIVPSEIFD